MSYLLICSFVHICSLVFLFLTRFSSLLYILFDFISVVSFWFTCVLANWMTILTSKQPHYMWTWITNKCTDKYILCHCPVASVLCGRRWRWTIYEPRRNMNQNMQCCAQWFAWIYRHWYCHTKQFYAIEQLHKNNDTKMLTTKSAWQWYLKQQQQKTTQHLIRNYIFVECKMCWNVLAES